MAVLKIAVIGAGQMGAGIAQTAAQNGYEVFLCDPVQAALDKARDNISKSLAKLFEKKTISEDSTAVLKRLNFGSDLKQLATFDPSLVIEAIVEKVEIKTKLFQDLESIVKANCIFASNTSSISISAMAAATKRADKFVGMHFMNPVPLMKLVELIPGSKSSEGTLHLVREVATKMGKTLVTSKDRPGFIVNRILMPMINEAVIALSEGLGTAEDIDTGMKLGTNQPMGPLALADLIGLDTCLFIMQVLHDGLKEAKYQPAPLLHEYVEAGKLGRKTKSGFYNY